MTNKKHSTPIRRAKIWKRYYDSKTPDRTSEDWVHKECENCGAEMILNYKERDRKFCNLSCSVSSSNRKRSQNVQEASK